MWENDKKLSLFCVLDFFIWNALGSVCEHTKDRWPCWQNGVPGLQTAMHSIFMRYSLKQWSTIGWEANTSDFWPCSSGRVADSHAVHFHRVLKVLVSSFANMNTDPSIRVLCLCTLSSSLTLAIRIRICGFSSGKHTHFPHCTKYTVLSCPNTWITYKAIIHGLLEHGHVMVKEETVWRLTHLVCFVITSVYNLSFSMCYHINLARFWFHYLGCLTAYPQNTGKW